MVGGLPPPPGVVPNFVNPYSLADPIRSVGTFFLVLVTLTTAFRFYTKFCIIKAHGWEDYTMFIAWWSNIFEILYPFLIAITKLSICLQFIQIFVLNRNKRFWFLQAFVLVNLLYFTACVFITIFQCTPRAKIWNPTLPGTCLDYQAYILTTGIFNVITDALLLGFPIICIWGLQMSTKRKLGISAVFFVGSLALTASITRVIVNVITYHSLDQTFSGLRIATCNVSEVAAGIVVGNLVAFPRLLATCRIKFTSLFSHRRPNELPSDAKPIKASSPSDYVELKEQKHQARGGQAKYADGGCSFLTSPTAYSDNRESPPYGVVEAGNAVEESNQIWKTVHVSQSERHLQ